MSRHEGVSCDSCLKGNFRGRRYKCLSCYDYDLCATCYETGAVTTRHTTEHPMQCILTRSDFDLFYGGETLSVEQPQSFTCPFCGKMGYTELTLHDHLSADHTNSSSEVVCPICAALPVGEPNHVTDDFLGHLTLEHRGTRELDESGIGSNNSRPVRRIPHPGRGGMNHGARRRHAAQMQFASSSTGFTSLSPSSRESMDPIAELLSQLSGFRRSATSSTSNSQSTSAQLQQLQMQLQLERQQAQIARQQLERLPAVRRQQHLQTAAAAAAAASYPIQPIFGLNSNNQLGGSILQASQQQLNLKPPLSNVHSSQFLLSRCTESSLSESEQNALEVEQADHSMFVQELLLMSLSEESSSAETRTDPESAIGSLLPVDNPERSNDSQESAGGRSSSPSKKSEDAAASKTVPTNSNELLSHSSIVHSRKHASNNPNSKIVPMKQQQQQSIHQQQQPQPVLMMRDNSLQSPVGRMGLPPRISGSGTQNIGGGASYNLRNQQGSGGSQSVRGGTPAGSTSSGRTRKVQRHLDDRNKSNEPPPPH